MKQNKNKYRFKVDYVILIIASFVFISCNETVEDKPSQIPEAKTLPIYGHHEFIEGVDVDTIYHTIPYWHFTNQDSVTISADGYRGTPYIAYFFFTHCPKICPKINSNMKYLQDQTIGLDYKVIAHTVDPIRDSVGRLKFYADEYEFDLSNYNFVTGNQKKIYELGVNSYLVPNQEDALAPGGFLHSEKLILIDGKSRIRGFYEGTEIKQVNQLIEDLKFLIEDEHSNQH